MQPILFIVVLLSWLSAASVKPQTVSPVEASTQQSTNVDKQQGMGIANQLVALPLAAHRLQTDGSDKTPLAPIRGLTAKRLPDPPLLQLLHSAEDALATIAHDAKPSVPRAPPATV